MRSLIVVLLVGMLSIPMYAGPGKKERIRPGQRQPDTKRSLQIQHALADHGYTAKITGKMDEQTKDVLRSIAKENNWQTHNVPDARVLILLGLGNEHSDPAVLEEHNNKLERKGEVDESKLEESRCIHRLGPCPGRPASASLSGGQEGYREASAYSRGRAPTHQ